MQLSSGSIGVNNTNSKTDGVPQEMVIKSGVEFLTVFEALFLACNGRVSTPDLAGSKPVFPEFGEKKEVKADDEESDSEINPLSERILINRAPEVKADESYPGPLIFVTITNSLALPILSEVKGKELLQTPCCIQQENAVPLWSGTPNKPDSVGIMLSEPPVEDTMAASVEFAAGIPEQEGKPEEPRVMDLKAAAAFLQEKRIPAPVGRAISENGMNPPKADYQIQEDFQIFEETVEAVKTASGLSHPISSLIPDRTEDVLRVLRPEQVVTEVVKLAEEKNWEDKNHSIVFRLEPESLGAVKVKVHWLKGEVRAEFVTETDQAAKALENCFNVLKQNLNQLNIGVSALSVAVSGQGSGGKNFSRRGKNRADHAQRISRVEQPEHNRLNNLSVDVLI